MNWIEGCCTYGTGALVEPAPESIVAEGLTPTSTPKSDTDVEVVVDVEVDEDVDREVHEDEVGKGEMSSRPGPAWAKQAENE